MLRVVGHPYAPGKPQAALARRTAPECMMISLTVTEGGCFIEDASERFFWNLFLRDWSRYLGSSPDRISLKGRSLLRHARRGEHRCATCIRFLQALCHTLHRFFEVANAPSSCGQIPGPPQRLKHFASSPNTSRTFPTICWVMSRMVCG